MENKKGMNIYVYVLAVAKRAKQLLKGESPKIDIKDYNVIKAAKREIDEGMIIPVIPREVIDNIDNIVEEPEEEE